MEYEPKDIEKCLQRKSWWAICFILPLARRLSLFFINNTSIRPTTITLGSFVFVLCSAYCFAQGTYGYLVLGAVFFEVNYLFDFVDGTIARVKKMGTPSGAYLDSFLDRVRIVLLAFCLAYGLYQTGQQGAAVLGVLLYLGVNNLIILTRAIQEKVLANHGFASRYGVDLVAGASRGGLIGWWLQKTQDRNIMPYYHDVELDALVFVVSPLLNMMLPFTTLAIVLGIILILVLNLVFLKSIQKGTVN